MLVRCKAVATADMLLLLLWMFCALGVLLPLCPN